MLDVIDSKVLQELELNGRQSSSSIAKKLKLNKAVVNYRIERLQRNGIITGFQYVSNQVILGKLSFGLLIQLKDVSYDEEVKIINQLEKATAWVKSITGTWDLIAVIIEKDFQSFMQVLNQIFSLIGNKVKNYSFYVDYEGGIKGQDYLYTQNKNLLVRYASTGNIQLEGTELDVFNELKKSPRSSLLEIASKLNKSYDTIKSKYLALKTKKVLLRCTPLINITTIGYQEHLCLFDLSPDLEKINALVHKCVKNPNVTRYSKCLGHFNLMLNIHTKNDEELKEVLYSLKKEYSQIINYYELIRTR